MAQKIHPSQHKKHIFIVVAIVLIGLGFWGGRSVWSEKNNTDEKPVQPVADQHQEVATDQILISAQQIQQAGIQLHALTEVASQVQGKLDVQGQVQWAPESIVVLTSPVAGLVQQVMVQPLTEVAKHKQVVQLHSPELIQIQNEILQLTAQQQLAQQNLNRERRLYAEGIIAEKRVQLAQAELQTLNIDLSAKQRLLQFMGGSSAKGLNPVVYVKSPAKGTLQSLAVSAGQYVETGAVLGQIIDSEVPLQLLLQVTAAQGQSIQVGDRVTVDGCEVTGKVQKMASALAANTQTQNIVVQMQQQHPCLSPQQFVKAQIHTENNNPQHAQNPSQLTTWVVPNESVSLKEGQYLVFVRNSNGFVAVPVQRVATNDSQSYIVAKALKAEMQLAASGVERLKAVWSGFGAEQVPTSNRTEAAS